MRIASPLLLVSLALGLLLPASTSADRLAGVGIGIGSLDISASGGSPLTTQLVGIAIIADTGLEKSWTIQIPPFVLPVVLAGEDGLPADQGGPGKKPFLNRRFDTTLVLTNTTSTSLVLELTLRDGDGDPLTPSPVVRTLGARATIVVAVSDLLP